MIPFSPMANMPPQKIEVSSKTIVFTVFFLIGIWLVYQIREIIIALFISFVLMSALNPSIDRLEKYGLPRWTAILSIYIVILGILSLLLVGILPPLIEQTTSMLEKAPVIFAQFNFPGLNSGVITSQFSQLLALPSNILRWIVNIFSNIVNFFALLVLTFYLLLERKNLDRYLAVLFGNDGQKKVKRFIKKGEERLGGWVRGQLVMMTTIGVVIYFGLRILGIDYALPLAILSGLTEIIPYIGPVIAAIPAVSLGLLVSPFMGLAVAAFYFLVQQIEGNIIVPKVMERATGVNPLITILALSVGFKIAGVVGAVLALPVVLLLEVIISESGFFDRFSPK